jgi:protease I
MVYQAKKRPCIKKWRAQIFPETTKGGNMIINIFKMISVSILLMLISYNIHSQEIGGKEYKASDFTLKLYNLSDKISLSQIVNKNNAVLLIFFTTECPYCHRETPGLVKVYNEYKEKGVEFIGIEGLGNVKEIEKFVNRYKIKWPVTIGEKEVFQAYEIRGVPTHVIVDRNGKIIFSMPGALKEDKLKKELEKVIAKEKILLIIANKDFRDEEYFQPKEIFLKNKYKVVTASSSLNEAKGMLGEKIKPDIILDDVKVEDYSAIIFVGGVGATEYFLDSKAHKIAKEAFSQGKIIGAICIAPAILAYAGILKDKKATSYPSVKDDIVNEGGKYTGKSVEVDGKIVTANGPQSAKEFATKILELIKSEKK